MKRQNNREGGGARERRRTRKKKAERLILLESKLAIKLQYLRQYGHKQRQMNAQGPETDPHIHMVLTYDSGVPQTREKLTLRKQLGMGHRLASSTQLL